MEPEDAEPQAEPSFTALVADLTADVALLVRQELALAGAEMTQKARDAGKNAILVGIGALLGTVSLLVLVAAVILALGSIVPMWVSAFVIAGLIGAAGLVTYSRGVTVLRTIHLLPTETIASLKADRAFAKDQIGATRDQMAATLAEVRHRLQPPPAEPAAPKKTKRPAKRTKSP
jgi:hypothetical protein